MADQQKADLSVVIARFQTPVLTPAHMGLLRQACRNGHQVLILLGCSTMITKRNPLPFSLRSEMVFNMFKANPFLQPNQVHILPLIDPGDDVLEPVYRNGEMLRVQDFTSVRENANRA